MSTHTTAALLSANDQRFLELARALDGHDWATPSLCAEWTNHEVLAHLVIGYRASAGVLAAGMIRHRGSFDAANTGMARELAAAHCPDELLDEFDRLRARPRGVARVFPKRLLLGDHVIHELDIIFVLGRRATIPAATLVAVLNTQVTVPNPFVPARRRAHGLHLRATDADWRHGTDRGGRCGVTGTAADLASVLAGRDHALNRLTGGGVSTLRARLAHPALP